MFIFIAQFRGKWMTRPSVSRNVWIVMKQMTSCSNLLRRITLSRNASPHWVKHWVTTQITDAKETNYFLKQLQEIIMICKGRSEIPMEGIPQSNFFLIFIRFRLQFWVRLLKAFDQLESRFFKKNVLFSKHYCFYFSLIIGCVCELGERVGEGEKRLRSPISLVVSVNP